MDEHEARELVRALDNLNRIERELFENDLAKRLDIIEEKLAANDI